MHEFTPPASAAKPLESPTEPDRPRARRLGGPLRVVATSLLALGLLAVGGTAVVNAASPAASSSPAASGSVSTPGVASGAGGASAAGSATHTCP